MAAITKQICLLDIREYVGGISTVRVCFWLPQVKAYPSTNIVSAYVNVDSDPLTSTSGQGISAALRAGTIVEETYGLQFPTSAIVNNWGTVEAIILAFYQSRFSYHAGTNAVAIPDIGAKLGVMYDSATGWSA